MTVKNGPSGLERLRPARAHLRRADPVMRQLIDAHPDFNPRAWLTELPEMDAFGALIFQIIGQQLSVKATRRLLARLQDQFAGRLPTPAEIVAADPAVLHAAGLSRRKVQTIRALAAEFTERRISAEALRGMSDAEIEAQLTEVPGIGPWTVHGFLIIALDRDDVVLRGDLALRKAIQRNYDLDHLPSEDEVLRLAEPWRPYRTLASAYLFATALN
ncbi:MAG: DNA-3-methyladenine glycosylase family protein [Solirubrobacteraceae bacterium]